MRQLEGKMIASDSAKPRGKADIPKYDAARQGSAGAALISAPKSYNADADVTANAGKEEPKKKKKVIELLINVIVVRVQVSMIVQQYLSAFMFSI